MTGIAFGLFYATLGVPIARWSDRGNRVTITSMAIALWGMTVMSCLFVSNFAQLLAALRAFGQVALQALRLLAGQRAYCVERQVIAILFVCRHGAISLRRKSKPSRMRDLTVPSGSPVRVAISACVRPSR